MRAFPAASYLRFMENHGLLAASGQPCWRAIRGGSHTYVKAMATRLGAAVCRVRRSARWFATIEA